MATGYSHSREFSKLDEMWRRLAGMVPPALHPVFGFDLAPAMCGVNDRVSVKSFRSHRGYWVLLSIGCDHRNDRDMLRGTVTREGETVGVSAELTRWSNIDHEQRIIAQLAQLIKESNVAREMCPIWCYRELFQHLEDLTRLCETSKIAEEAVAMFMLSGDSGKEKVGAAMLQHEHGILDWIRMHSTPELVCN